MGNKQKVLEFLNIQNMNVIVQYLQYLITQDSALFLGPHLNVNKCVVLSMLTTLYERSF